MSPRSIGLSDALHAFLVDFVSEPALLRELRTETEALPGSGMQISPEQGHFMAWLVRLIAARRCIELGVYTGYSSLSVALALPADGLLLACDVNPETTLIARRYWERAGVASKIELQLGPALQTLDARIREGESGAFDFAFVDADKGNYPAYYQRCLTLLRPGGVLAFDNALWSGKIADAARNDADTRAIREVLAIASSDARVEASLLPVGDGLLLVRKR